MRCRKRAVHNLLWIGAAGPGRNCQQKRFPDLIIGTCTLRIASISIQINLRRKYDWQPPHCGGKSMNRLLVGLALFVSAAVAFISSAAEAQQARNLAEFCVTWQGVCNRTCPSGAGNCTRDCASRVAACRSSGCFHFNNPGPRCFNSARDRARTDAKYAPDPKRAMERRQKARESGN